MRIKLAWLRRREEKRRRRRHPEEMERDGELAGSLCEDLSFIAGPSVGRP